MADYCPLPLDVVVTILVCLPVISLLRLRSVCKSWRALIDSSHFIRQHLLHEDADSNVGLIVKSQHSRYQDLHHQLHEDANGNGLLILKPHPLDWTLLSGHQFEVRVNIDPNIHFSSVRDPPYDQDQWSLVDSCNGIVCLSNITHERLCVALWNPATRQLACLQELLLQFTECLRMELGFGYAVKADDYKVVRVVEFMSLDLPSVLHCQVEIYNLNTNCLRNIDVNSPFGPFRSATSIYCNGCFFWDLVEEVTSRDLVEVEEEELTSRHISILSFDFNNEAFEIMLLPDVLSRKKYIVLTTMRDTIAYIDNEDELRRDGQFDIWVMTKYGVKDSWTKLHTVRLIGPFTFVLALGLSKNGEILLLNQTEAGIGLACSDLKTRQIKNLNLFMRMEHAVYKESLVSIRKAMYPTDFPIVRNGTANTLTAPTTQPLDCWTGDG